MVSFSVLPQALWFDSFGYFSVWWFSFKFKFIAFLIGFSLSLLCLGTNFWFANRNAQAMSSDASSPHQYPAWLQLIRRLLTDQLGINQTISRPSLHVYQPLSLVIATILAIGFGLAARSKWLLFFKQVHHQSMGISDPIFNNDISYYLFTLPFYDAVQGWLLSLVLVTLIGVLAIYFSRNLLPILFSKSAHRHQLKAHIFVLASVWFLLIALGIALQIYTMLYSGKGAVFGAGYTDVTALAPSYKLIIGLYVTLAIATLIWAFTKTVLAPLYGFLAIFVIQLLALSIIPNLIQTYVVTPNQFEKEKPYIAHNISFTRLGYGLDSINEMEFPASNTLRQSDIVANLPTIQNIRLWNQGPLKSTFGQLQEIRLYYEFINVDVDRYTINNRPTQVMLSARELDINQLTGKAQTWINRHLVFTHGYGAVMAPVSDVTPEGLPKLFVQNLPPTSITDIPVTRPEIYFGENTQHYVVANTLQQEFDYPKGNTNVYTHYQGSGGIQLDSWFKRLLYAIHLSDIKILISPQITSSSRLLYDRTIRKIAKTLAPFIAFDNDPYLVIDESGRLKWMLDGYTLSNQFPYSEPFQGRYNYVRNAVKVTIDAYNGETLFYIADDTDPIIQTYASIFPNLFKPLSTMPSDLQSHIRYPKGLFQIQSEKFLTYHMTDPQVFYNREDLWAVAKETYEPNFASGQSSTGHASQQLVNPYYTVMKSPGQASESFVLMQPFTPTNKHNLISWLSVESDRDNYGKMTIYKLPKQKVVFGPMQIESRIDQDPDISQKLTLWGQSGSEVIRGNLMLVPIENALLYVEPIYLKATQSELPELKRVILAYGNTVEMAPTLSEAIQRIFNTSTELPDVTSLPIDSPIPDTSSSSITLIKQTFQSAKIALRQSDWLSFGKAFDKLDSLLNKKE